MCGVHGQDREHDRDVVDDGGDEAHRDIGRGRPPLHVHELRGHGQVADEAEAADAEDHPVEEQQGVPLGSGHLVEDVERAMCPPGRPPARHALGVASCRACGGCGLQEEAEELEIAQASQHPATGGR